MRLSTRLMIAMTALVLGMAAVGMLGYRNVESAVLPVSLDRLMTQARARLGVLDILLRDVRGDVLTLRAIPSHDGLVRARQAGGIDPVENISAAKLQERLEGIYVARLRFQPLVRQLRLIGVADGSREIIRVDRLGPGGTIRVVPQAELQRIGDRSYFRDAIALAADQVYVSPIQLNQEHGAADVPEIPELRFASRINDSEGRPFGIFMISVDVRPTFDSIRAAMDDRSMIYVVNATGDFLLHPDPSRAFGFEFGRRYRWQDELPGLEAAIGPEGRGSAVVEGAHNKRVAAAIATAHVAGGPLLGVIETASYDSIMAPALALRRSNLWIALGAVGVAIVLATWMARVLTRPLRQITAAVEGFGRGEPIQLPDAGNGEIGILSAAFARMARDVGEANAALREKSEVFDKTIESMSDGILIVNAQGRTVFANAVCRALFGHDLPVGVSAYQQGHQRFQTDGVTPLAAEDAPLARALRGERFENVEFVFRRGSDPNLIHVTASGGILSGPSDRVDGAVVVYRNLTRFKETERQLQQAQKMEAVGQLTGGVAHDFNNILTVLTGGVEIISEGVKNQPGLALVAQMLNDAVDRGADLTHQLLAFARKQPLQPRLIDVNAMVSDSARLLRPTLGEKVEIETRLVEEPWLTLADPAQLSSALLNLAVNARDAMPSGGRLTLETGNVMLDEAYAEQNVEVVPGPYAMIAVSDTGTGIPATILDRVFDPFFTTKPIGKGTGLGLSMVYGFVLQSGGHIKIYSEEGYGTTIKIFLPRAELAGPAPVTTPAPAITGGQEVLLVVEDDELVRSYVITNLVSLGYRVHTATNAAEALAMVQQGLAFDLLFTDIVLGAGINGRQLADEIRALRPGLKVLYTSGYTEDAVVHHGRVDAGVRLLTKPYRRADLARMLRLALDGDGAAAT